MEKRKSNLCRIAILKTLSYSAVFGYPLTFYQITNGLITKNNFASKKIKKELDRLVESRIVKKTKKRYVLRGIRSHDVDKRKKSTNEIIEQHKTIIKILARIPWIKMVALTGSVANLNAVKDTDIDLLFVTEKNRLWISRGFVFLILKTLGKLPRDKSKREICPNIFIDERSLSWAKKNRNLYVAQNILSMQPFIWRDNTYFDFIQANMWIKKYYKNFNINFPKRTSKSKSSGSAIMKLLESLAKNIEIAYMKKDITTEIANDKLIHFNKNDSRKKILSEYKKILKKS